MDPAGALVSVYYATKAGTFFFHQSGVSVGNYVITAANRVFITETGEHAIIKKIVITTKNIDNNLIKKNATVEIIWQSKEVEKVLKSAFTFLNMFKDQMSGPFHWSYFVLLKTENSSEHLREIINGLKLEEQFVLVKGLDILVSYTPFGSGLLLDSVSGGIISNTFGENADVFLIDARLAASSEGSPIYRDCTCKKVLIGILVYNIPYSETGAMIQSGFSLAVNIVSLFQSLRKHMAHEKSEFMEIKSSIRTSCLLKPDYVVSIEHGVGHGAGVIIAADGLVMTCGHVVNFAQNAEVKVRHQNMMYDATVLYASNQNSNVDIAFVVIKSTKKFPTCHLASRHPKKGESVYSVGQGMLLNTLTPFMSKGFITQYQSKACFISSCIVLNGSSGGVIVRPNGEVIGIITAMVNVNSVPYPFLSYCLPVCHLTELIVAFKRSRGHHQIKK